jgi:hypothetical protein
MERERSERVDGGMSGRIEEPRVTGKKILGKRDKRIVMHDYVCISACVRGMNITIDSRVKLQS